MKPAHINPAHMNPAHMNPALRTSRACGGLRARACIQWAVSCCILAGCQRRPDEPVSRGAEGPSAAAQIAPAAPTASAVLPIRPALPLQSLADAAGLGDAAAVDARAPDAAAGGVVGVANCPEDPDPFTPGAASYSIGLREIGLKITSEFVQTTAATARGLMYRKALAEDRGMLFLLPRRAQTFWMHNTCISLDMVFAERDGTIVGIVERATPLTDKERGVALPSSFVLELPGGFAERHGLRAGQHLDFPAEVQAAQPRRD
jgi:uncharacterized protein